MRSTQFSRRTTRLALAGAMLVGTAFTTGCQVEMGGQTLPSAFYQQDDFQYYPPGPEFTLSNEAAHMQQMEAQQAAQIQ